MKPGLHPGQQAFLEITVTPQMLARLGERILHPVYGTAALVAHLEEASRNLIEPYLEPEEEAVGFALDLRHRALTPLGAVVRVTARVTEVRETRIVCEVEAVNAQEPIAGGTFTQAIVTKSLLEARIVEAAAKLAVGRFATKE